MYKKQVYPVKVGTKTFTDKEKIEYYKKKANEAAYSARTSSMVAEPSYAPTHALYQKKPYVRKLPTTRDVLAKAPLKMKTLKQIRPASLMPLKLKRSAPKVSLRAAHHTGETGYARGFTKHSGASHLGGKVKGSRMESISNLIAHQGFDKDAFSENLDKRLKERSLYYQSLLDPLQGAGAKIPDMTAIPTGTFQMVQRIPVTSNLQGIAAIRVASPQFAPANITTLTQQFGGYQTSNGAATAGSLTWGAITDFTGWTGFNGNVSFARCVSASLTAEYLGTELQDSGHIVGQFAPGAFASPGSVTQLANFPYSSDCPVNRNEPFMVRYLPQGFYDVPFVPGAAVQSDSGPHPDSMIIVMSDIPASTNTMFVFCANYEFQPTSTAVNIVDVAPSPIDVYECGKIAQWTQELETSGIIPADKVDVMPSAAVTNRAEAFATSTEQEDSLGGMGMLGDVLDFALPVLMKAIPALL